MVEYAIKNENGLNVDINILENYYGNLWRAVLNRLNHEHDGYLVTIYDREFKLHVYRILTAS